MAVPLAISNAPGLASVSMTLNYDPQILTMLSVTNGRLGDTFRLSSELTDGRVRMVAVRDTDLSSADGVLAILWFQANPQAIPGMVSALTVADRSFADQHGRDFDWSGNVAQKNGSLSIGSVNVDSDGDGLPDWWETLYFGSATSAGPLDDPDGDRLTNLQEFLAGTDPTINPGFYIVLTGLNPTYDGTSRVVTGSTTPANLIVTVTYNGSPVPPINAGVYTVVGSVSEGNYVGSVTNTMVVGKQALTVAAGDKSRSYGTANPVFTGMIAGVRNRDGITAAFSTVAGPLSPAGRYDIVPVIVDPNGRIANYSVVLKSGILTVTADDPPLLTLSGAAWIYTVGTVPVLIDTNTTVFDGGSLDFDGGMLAVSLLTNANSLDVLGVSPQTNGSGQIGITGLAASYGEVVFASVSGGHGGAPLLFCFNTNASPVVVQALVRRLTFETGDRSNSSKTVEIVLTDGDGGVSLPALKALTINRPPLAGDDTYVVALNSRLTNSIAELLANDQDLDGDLLVQTSVALATDRGGVVEKFGTDLVYTPPAMLQGWDTFTYEVSDGRGGAGVGKVRINIRSFIIGQPWLDSAQLDTTGGGMVIWMVGQPRRSYRIEASNAVGGPVTAADWAVIGHVVTSSDGSLQLLDTAAPHQPRRFYRVMEE